ncbi:MAG: hypothetical protein ABSA47_01995 [Verrucomicrobiota bacterium]
MLTGCVQHLSSRRAPDLTGWDKDNANFEAQLEKVIQALRADARARELPPSPRL